MHLTGVYSKLFPNLDGITLSYPPKMGCITDVIPPKMSAITLLCTSKKLVIAPKKNIKVITYMKNNIHLRKIQKLVKMSGKKNTIKYFGGISYFSKKIPPRNSEIGKNFRKRKNY